MLPGMSLTVFPSEVKRALRSKNNCYSLYAVFVGLVGCSSSAGLQPGVVLDSSSSIKMSFAASRASYLPAQPGCNAEYEAIISVDQQMTRAVGIVFGDSEQLDTDYLLQPCASCGMPVFTNFLVGDSDNIQIDFNGIETLESADQVSMGSIRFEHLTGNLQFEFSFSFSDGKLLRGTFNLPIKSDLICPLPQM
jgi:hypothetical protein